MLNSIIWGSDKSTASMIYKGYQKQAQKDLQVAIYAHKQILKSTLPYFFNHLDFSEYWYATPFSYSFLMYLFEEDDYE